MSNQHYKKTYSTETMIIKKCHVCGFVNEGQKEMESCQKCKKGFLPLNYFSKVHAKTSEDFKNLFSHSEDLHPDDLIKGINVLW